MTGLTVSIHGPIISPLLRHSTFTYRQEVRMNPIRTMIAAVVAGSVATGAMAANGDSGVYVGVQGGYQHTSIKEKTSLYTDDSNAVDGFAGGLYGGVKFNTADNFYVAGELNVGTSRTEYEYKSSLGKIKGKFRAS